jgi:CBS domain-containing protein
LEKYVSLDTSGSAASKLLSRVKVEGVPLVTGALVKIGIINP